MATPDEATSGEAGSHRIDPAFRADRQRLARRRGARRLRQRIVAGGFAAAAAIGAACYVWLSPQGSIPIDAELAAVAVDEAARAEVESGLAAAEIARPMMLDLPGDPLMVTLGGGAGRTTRLRVLDRPEGLKETVAASRLALLSDRLLSAGERLMVQIPSSQADFAFFQAQRLDPAGEGGMNSAEEAEAVVGDLSAASGEATEIENSEAAGWGETVEAGASPLPEFEKTAIEDTTSIARLRPEDERFTETESLVERLLAPVPLARILIERGLQPESAKAVADAARDRLGVEGLAAGMVMGVNARRPSRDAGLEVAQLSLYAGERYLGTLSRNEAGVFVPGADPFAGQDLLSRTGAQQTQGRQYRLLDAVYSAAMRNGVPMQVVGEAIMLLSRDHDLDAIATPEDRFDLLYEAPSSGGSAGGEAPRVRYAALRRREGPIACFVFDPSSQTPSCHGKDADSGGGAASAAGPSGMIVPVKGVLTSTFGPRRHPILKKVRIHKGVDFAAPIGTKVHAAFAGTIVYAGDGKGYGNLLRIDHGGGRETRYAHLDRFAPGAKPGRKVAAGELIGTIGTTGLSTGPHLHFEMYLSGKAVDPLAREAQAAPAKLSATGGSAVSGDGAVDQLVGWIVRVESGGNARAKNPLSSATGLGQFISSTWLRMVRDYRPDLATSLSRTEILDLRYDPTLSREMIRHLAREGEAYLVRRGHRITAGRLYLAHFLGMDGAHKVLSADEDAAVVDVVGAGVIRANPFLAGKNVRNVIDWAELKMRSAGRGGRSRSEPAVSTVRPAVANKPDPAFAAYRKAILAFLEANGVPS
ncbi:M23 family metallopeptidase [Jiella mangrovi]|uniref:M23 family metallopeptidase n=1 Tax=Jiella mangrovi TaxID=2821407 RepID=A0ABS4BIZ8_9HYPH|nr:M23 family metallopeptidase [Jiella mangrovi]MBP0616742.1 M23 family metallopeptidase [Jiella mangrovi]